MTIRFVLKNGKEIDMECEAFESKVNQLNGKLCSFTATDVTKNKILSIDVNEVVAVYRLDNEIMDKTKRGENNE
jgi:hypothetical protein